MNKMLPKYITLIIFTLLIGCKENKSLERSLPPIEKTNTLDLKYAKGFTITKNGNHTILEIKSPWPKAKKSFKYVLISPKEATKTTFMRDAYDGVILTPIESMVVTSTTAYSSIRITRNRGQISWFSWNRLYIIKKNQGKDS